MAEMILSEVAMAMLDWGIYIQFDEYYVQRCFYFFKKIMPKDVTTLC